MSNQNPYANNQPLLGNQYAPQPQRPQNPYAQPPAGNFQPFPPQPAYAPPNQGFQQNQGFQPNQGFVPGGQGFIPNFAGGTLMCPFCVRETGNITQRAPGGVTWIWCFALFLFTGICCCIPFCVDSCKDTVFVCTACQGVKGRQEANCC